MIGRVTAAAAAGIAAALAGRYVAGRAQADRQTVAELESRLTNLGEVERLSILPLVERHTSGTGLLGEPGVSYLVRADSFTLLFDTGLGTGTTRNVLESNVSTLGAELGDLDAVVISHLHADHVGGPRQMFRHTFGLGPQLPLPRSLPAYVPTEMTHPDADVCPVDRARVIGPGVAVLPPLPRMLFWPGPIAEQALVVHVRGRGLVLITGCGHPEIERVLAAVERIVGLPVHAVIGGLHLPVHGLTSGQIPQAVLGSPNWPWQPISEAQAREVIRSIQQRGPGLVALSGHDSTRWTIDAFDQVFGEKYRTLRVGEEVLITAA